MERKTKVTAEEGKHDLFILREFELPVELLFKAHAEPDILEQWMSHEYGICKVLKYENKKHGGWRFQTSDLKGTVMLSANGVFHEFSDSRIVRTFEIENSPVGVQLESLQFEKLTDDTSKLTMHIVYQTVEQRDFMLKQPFAHGLSMAHDRLQKILSKFN